jgi:hypothetical protein
MREALRSDVRPLSPIDRPGMTKFGEQQVDVRFAVDVRERCFAVRRLDHAVTEFAKALHRVGAQGGIVFDDKDDLFAGRARRDRAAGTAGERSSIACRHPPKVPKKRRELQVPYTSCLVPDSLSSGYILG